MDGSANNKWEKKIKILTICFRFYKTHIAKISSPKKYKNHGSLKIIIHHFCRFDERKKLVLNYCTGDVHVSFW